jgi:peptidoglycan/xylan/chitin deacetylase (PgdA/CDA1 family)
MNMYKKLRYKLVTMHVCIFIGLLIFFFKPWIWPIGRKASEYRVIISFDDDPSDYMQAIEPMKQFGYVGVACVTVSWTDVSTIQLFVDAGWEIASHSMTHPQMIHLDAERLEYEISESKRWLEQNVPSCAPVITFAYPNNQYNLTIEEIVAKYYVYGRTAAGALNKTKTWDNSPTYELPALAVGPKNCQTDLPVALSALQNGNGTLVLVFHSIGDDKGLDLKIFVECLEMIKESGAQVSTFKDIM